MRRLQCLSIILAFLLIAPAARADIEGNNSAAAAEGPLAGGTPYQGTIGTPDDEDWYSLYVNGHVTMTVTLTSLADSACGNVANLIGSNGGNALRQAAAPLGRTGTFTYETPAGVNRYFLQMPPGCKGRHYEFRVDTNPPGALVAGDWAAATDVVNTEPNEGVGTAFGPMSPFKVYGGTVDSQTDQDWFYFYTSGTTPFDVALFDGGLTCKVKAYVYQDGAPAPLDELAAANAARDHTTYTPTGPARYLIQVVAGCGPAPYQLIVTPPEALATKLPPSGACLAARKKVRQLRAKRKTKLTRYKLKAAKKRAKANCA